jgi:hypothetical protein
MTMIAEEERRMISRRTEDALAAVKRRGVKLDGYRAASKLTAKARKGGQEVNTRIAAYVSPVIAELQAAGATSLRAIPAGLNARGVENGTELWRADLPAGGQATPMTYVTGGRQYLVVAAGGHNRLGTTRSGAIVAFALPEK